MWCINMAKLYMGLLWVLTIFNFITIFILVCFAVPAWNKTADKIFPYRCFGNYRRNAIDEINEKVVEIEAIKREKLRYNHKRDFLYPPHRANLRGDFRKKEDK